MNRLVLSVLLQLSMAISVTSCNSDMQNRVFATKNKVPAVVAEFDIKEGEVFNRANLGSKLVELYTWQIGMPVKEALFDKRANRDILHGEPITIEDIMTEDRTKWTQYDEKRNREIQNTFPGYENYYLLNRDMKKGEPFLTVFLVRRQVRKGGPRKVSLPPGFKTDEYSGKIPVDAIRSLAEVRGKKAKNDIKANTPVRRVDLDSL